MRKKNALISFIVAGALSLTAIALCSIEPVSVFSETAESEFIIQEGASVRFATAAETQEGKAVNGIRFAAYITETYYQTLTQTTYPTATEIVLQSTVSKVVDESETAPSPFTCSWDLKEPIVFNEKGIATFYHTLNFNSLTGENLKAANAFDMEADFWIEVKTESESEPIKIEADNAAEVSTVRSMRQVAYAAYTIEGTDEKPNNAYQDNRLKTYFTLGASTEAAYDMDVASKAILETAPENVVVDKVYTLNEENSAFTDVTDKTLATDTGAFTAEDANAGAIKTLVYFDENNVAYTTKMRFVTKIVDNETELMAALKWNTTGDKTVNPWGYHLLSTDITVSQPLANKNQRVFKYGTLDGDGHKITVSTASTASDDKNFYQGLFGSLTTVTVKNLEIDLTRDFGPQGSAPYQSLLAIGADATSLFENVCVHISRASGDVSANYLTSNKHRLYLVGNGTTSATAKNVVVHVAENVFIPKEGYETKPLIVIGFKASTSWYVFSSEASANSSNYKLYPSVADAISAGEKFLSLRESGYFTFNETEKTLTFGKTNESYDAAMGVTITQTEVAGAEEENITDYKTFRSIAEAKYLVPGLNEGIVPQGMDVWEEKELLFISGYFKDASDNTSGSPSSLLLTVDLKTGKHVGTYCLKGSSGTYSSTHAGGVAITEKNLFISSGSSLHRIPLSQIEKKGAVGTLTIVDSIKVPVIASYCNYSNGVLWVGDWIARTGSTPDTNEWQHMTNNDGTTYYAGCVGYKLKDTASEFSSENWDSSTMAYATPDYYLSTTDRIQGFTWVGDRIIMSQSEGIVASQILVYDNVLKNAADTSVTLNGKEVPVWFLDSGVQAKNYSAMPMSEGITCYDGKLLILFESAAKPYSPKVRTDHVWSVTLPE